MTYTINPLNVVSGPANVYVATFGATEPAQTNAALIADPDSGIWTPLGATINGCTWEEDQTIREQRADQFVDAIGGRITSRKVMVTFDAEEVTLAALAIMLNNFGTVTVGAGISVFDPGQPDGGTPPTYSAILVDGQAPQLNGGGEARRRAIFRKVLNTSGKVGVDNDPSKDATLPGSFQCFGVSRSIRPYVVMDQTA